MKSANLVLLMMSVVACRTEPTAVPEPSIRAPVSADARMTLLFFGLSSRDGRGVSEQQWQDYVETVVTPNFPDGLTVLNAYGQYLTSDQQVASERTKVLLLIHADDRASDERIAAVIAHYKRRFDQDSVLRVDTDAAVQH